MLAALCIEAQRDQHDAILEVNAIDHHHRQLHVFEPDASHCPSRSLLKATKRRETALFETAAAPRLPAADRA